MPSSTPSQAVYINELDPITTVENGSLLHYQTSGGADKYIDVEDFRDEIHTWQRDNASAVGVDAVQTYGELSDDTAGAEYGLYTISAMVNGALTDLVEFECSILGGGLLIYETLQRGLRVTSPTLPWIMMTESGASVDEKNWGFTVLSEELKLFAFDDSYGYVGLVLEANRGWTSTTESAVKIGVLIPLW